MSSLVAMMMTGTKMRKANPPRFCNAATIPLTHVHLKVKGTGLRDFRLHVFS
jgi:hypothetical protein